MSAERCSCCRGNPAAVVWDGRAWVPLGAGVCKRCLFDPGCRGRPGHAAEASAAVR